MFWMIATEMWKRLRDYFDILFRLVKLSKTVNWLINVNKWSLREKKIYNQKTKHKNLKENHQKLTSSVSASFQEFKKYFYSNSTAITIRSQSA